MKKVLFLIFIAFLASCNRTGEEKIPPTIEAKRKLLAKKQAELGRLKSFIQKLQDSIEAQAPTKKKVKLVTAAPIAKKKFEHFIEVQSTVQSEDMANASSELGGRILQMSVKEGDYVRKGAVIAVLDASHIKKQIEQVENSLALARDVYQRQERLWSQKIGTEMQYLQAKNRVEQLEKNLELLHIRLSKNQVIAPLSGVVEQVFLEKGELAGPGMPVVRILNPHRLKIVGQVPETYIKRVHRNQRVTVVVPALDDMEFSARIHRLGTTIHPTNRTFSIEIASDSKKGLLKPNMVAKIVLKDKEIPQAIVIPAELLRQDVEGNDFVMVAVKEGTHTVARKRLVAKGDSYKGKIVINEGLKEGDLLIMKGAKDLVDGEEIEIVENTVEE